MRDEALSPDPSFSSSDLESATCHESLAEKGSTRLDKGCRIHFHSRTQRLADEDGRSCKAALDGLVIAGILPDDNAKFVKEITHSQEIAADGREETVIDLWWED